MEIQIKAYAYTIDIITEIRYFCKCNNAVFGKFRIIFTCAISKTDCSLHHSFHALFKISGNEKFVRTTTLASLVKGEVLSPERIRATTGGIAAPPSLAPHQPFQKPTLSLSLFVGEGLAPPVAPNTAISTIIVKGQPSFALHHHPCHMNALLALRPLQSWSFAVGASCTDFLRPLVSIRA